MKFKLLLFAFILLMCPLDAAKTKKGKKGKKDSKPSKPIGLFNKGNRGGNSNISIKKTAKAIGVQAGGCDKDSQCNKGETIKNAKTIKFVTNNLYISRLYLHKQKVFDCTMRKQSYL